MAAYNTHNSLSPMMFKKASKGDKEGTRSERWRSKSVEHVFDAPQQQAKKKLLHARAFTDAVDGEDVESLRRVLTKSKWNEVGRLKGVAPVVACILPSLAMDFVASSLLAVGAVPLITEDPSDVLKDLSNCKAAVVDVSAPQVIVEAFLETVNTLSRDFPVVLVASHCGANDRKKELLMRLLDEVVPCVISGRLGDIYAVSQSVIEKNTSPLETPSDVSSSDEESACIPKVVLSEEKPEETRECKRDISSAAISPVMRRLIKKKSSSPPKVSNGSGKSPIISPTSSPRTSPRGSPVPSARGIKKLLRKKERPLERTPTALPMVRMKGQFRETQMSDVAVEVALEYAQKLCVYSGAYVHLYETNVVTSGELVVEILNTQQGMGNIHSTLPCSAAIMAAVLACVEREDDQPLSVLHCGHGLGLYHVAVEEAGAAASQSEKGLISPGILRQVFIDALHYLDERDVRSKALLKIHTQGIAPSTQN